MWGPDLVQQPSGVGRDRLEVPALGLGVKRAEGSVWRIQPAARGAIEIDGIAGARIEPVQQGALRKGEKRRLSTFQIRGWKWAAHAPCSLRPRAA